MMGADPLDDLAKVARSAEIPPGVDAIIDQAAAIVRDTYANLGVDTNDETQCRAIAVGFMAGVSCFDNLSDQATRQLVIHARLLTEGRR